MLRKEKGKENTDEDIKISTLKNVLSSLTLQ